jgi:dTDP-4-dehydrorhamnose reductase
MKVLVIGAEGQLGTAVCAAFADVELVRAELDSGDLRLDVTDKARATEVIVGAIKPEVVINTAAAHDLRRCEERPEWAFAVNATGAKNVAAACQIRGARLIHISTDYVFGDNHPTRPLVESDLPAPLNIYGASKLAGEHMIAACSENYCIVRTAGLYGVAPCRGKPGDNFVRSMLSKARAEVEVRVVDDEFTTPTYVAPLATQIRALAEKGEPGIYHGTCQGCCSWYEFAKAIFKEAGLQAKLAPISREGLSPAVRRPRFSVLDNLHLREQGLDIMPPWRDALRDYLSKLPRGDAVS